MAADQTQVADTVRTLTPFRPGTPFWSVNREWLAALGGARAVLLELAHPLVAAGVAAHSRYERDPFGRLYRTLQTMTALTFGQGPAVARAARHFQGCHRRVHGVLPAEIGPLAAGTPYAGDDPLLQLWVLATLIDSVLEVYVRFVRPLSAEERESYYQDARRLAERLGLAPALMPAAYPDFVDYMGAMLRSELLAVGAQARAIVAALYRPPVFGALAWRASFVGIGLLPAPLRAAYGFTWSPADERRLERWAALSRRLRPFVPDWLAVQPAARHAENQLSARSHSGAASAAGNLHRVG